MQTRNHQKQKLEAIFHAAQELTDPDQREIYLQDVCQGDAELRRKVEELLKASREEIESARNRGGPMATAH